MKRRTLTLPEAFAALDELAACRRKSARIFRQYAKDMLAAGNDSAAQYFRAKADLESRFARDVMKILRAVEVPR